MEHDASTCLPADTPPAIGAAVTPAACTAEVPNSAVSQLPAPDAAVGAGFYVPSCIAYSPAVLSLPLFSGATSAMLPPSYSYLQPPPPHFIRGGFPQMGNSIYHPYWFQEAPALSFGGAPRLQVAPCSREGRPPFSYSALIAMAIASSPKNMMSLPEIYNHISAHFPYYAKDDKRWKNSVRHNLSLNKCFKKVPREEEGYHGKGNYWMVDPASNRVLDRGSFRSPGKHCTHQRRAITNGSYPLVSAHASTSTNPLCKTSEYCCTGEQPKTNGDGLSFGVNKLLS